MMRFYTSPLGTIYAQLIGESLKQHWIRAFSSRSRVHGFVLDGVLGQRLIVRQLGRRP